MGYVLADTQATTMTTAVMRSAEIARMAVPLQAPQTHGLLPRGGRQEHMERHIHDPEKWRPPRALHPCMEQLLPEEPKVGLDLVPLHLGI